MLPLCKMLCNHHLQQAACWTITDIWIYRLLPFHMTNTAVKVLVICQPVRHPTTLCVIPYFARSFLDLVHIGVPWHPM